MAEGKHKVKWNEKNKLTWNEKKTWKHENLGLNKKFYLKLLKLCVPHLLQEYQHNEYIHENLKQNIGISTTPFRYIHINHVVKFNFKHSLSFYSFKNYFCIV
jgi:hypothetical protein